MNLPFLKLRVADHPWILFDRTTVPAEKGDGRSEPEWSSIALDICDRSRGAAARGAVVIEADGASIRIRTWEASGSPCQPPPCALLCASRWLFDAGRAGADSIQLRSESGDSEAIVIDSRNFGLSLGVPESADGSPLGDAFGARGLGLSTASGSGVMVPLRLGLDAIDVVLYDEPPSRRAPVRGPRGSGRVEALAVSRRELRIRSGGRDPLIAAAAALAAAVAAGYADREATALAGGDLLVAQWPEGGPVFVAAAPAYCLSGEFWTTER